MRTWPPFCFRFTLLAKPVALLFPFSFSALPSLGDDPVKLIIAYRMSCIN